MRLLLALVRLLRRGQQAQRPVLQREQPVLLVWKPQQEQEQQVSRRARPVSLWEVPTRRVLVPQELWKQVPEWKSLQLSR